MLPVTVENHDMPPPQSVENHAVEEKVNFLQTLNPFIQLLLAIGNAIFLPSFFVFNDFFKRLTPSQKVFFQAIQLPEPASPAADELDRKGDNQGPIDFEKQISQFQQRMRLLETRFKHDVSILEDMKELESLNFGVSELLDRLKGQKSAKESEADLATLKTLAQHLHEELDDFCVREGDTLLKQFQRVLEVFTRVGMVLPKEINEELLQTWKALENSIRPHLPHIKPADVSKKLSEKLSSIKKIMEGIQRNATQKQVSGLAEPLKLRNIGNSCYLDSVFQALAGVDLLASDLSRPISADDYPKEDQERFLKTSAIQQEIIQFLKVQSMNRGSVASKMGFVLFLLEGPSTYRLREAIFKSGFQQDFTKDTLTEQHDAAPVMELFIDHFLPKCRFKMQEGVSTTDFPGLEFNGPVADMTVLQVPLRIPQYQDLSNLIHWVMHKRFERESNPKDQRLFDPKDGKIVDEAEGEKSKLLPPQKVKEYIQWYRFKELPPVLALQFKRTISVQAKPDAPLVASKDERPVDLPPEGIVDLAKYYDASENGPKQTKYKIKSFVVHSGRSVHVGHYVTYAEINGNYFCCNDLDANGFKEITKKEFLSQKNAYLMILERLPEEDLAVVAGG